MVTIQLRRGTAELWSAVNPVLVSGEVGVETNTGLQKVGNGTNTWNDLPYVPNEPRVSGMIATALSGFTPGGDTEAIEALELRVEALESAPQGPSQESFDSLLAVVTTLQGTVGTVQVDLSSLEAVVAAQATSIDILEARVTDLEEDAPPPAIIPQVSVTTTGATFSPRVWLHADESPGVITWRDVDNNILATGLSPTISFGSAASRIVRMHATNPDAVETFSLGFTEGDDGGLYTVSGVAGVGAAYNHPHQLVTGISGLPNLPRLKNFCAATRIANGANRLTGNVSFSGLSELEFIECFQAQLTGVDLTGCDSLIRLCLEQNAFAGGLLDLNPVRTTLRDLRAAAQGGIEFAPISGQLTDLYHFCCRDQVVVNSPPMSQMPVVREPWLWYTAQTGTVVVWSNEGDYINYQLYGNSYSALEFDARLSDAETGGQLNLSGSNLVTITGMAQGRRLNHVEFNNCEMTTVLVDYILASVVAWNLSGSNSLDLRGNSGPSSVGEENAVILEGLGWTVQREAAVGTPDVTPPGPVISLAGDPSDTQCVLTWVNPTDSDLATIVVRRAAGSTAPANISSGTSITITGHPTTITDSGLTPSTQYSYGVWAVDSNGNVSTRATVTITTDEAVPVGDTLIWEDTFNRPDAIGTEAVGNGWYGTSPLNIVSNRLQRPAGSYQLHLREHTVAIPSSQDVAIEVDFPAGQMSMYIGVAARVFIDKTYPTQSGVRAFMTGSPNDFTLGACEGFNSNDVALTTIASPPAGWGTNPINTFRLELRGNDARILCDGVLVRTGVIPTAVSQYFPFANTAYGVCGEGNNRLVDAVRVYALA